MAVLENPELELAYDIADMTHDPLGFCEYAYPDSPRPWQKDVLEYIGNHLQDPETRHTPCCIAVSSGHGIGKSALVAMILEWALSTCEDCKAVTTANTMTQLDTKTVPRVEEWFRRSINAHWWELRATSITARDLEHHRTWRNDYVPWSETNTEAFAGLHNIGKRIVLIFDEASGIADKVWEVAEGALTDDGTEIIWLAFGNPTQNTGRFRQCFGRYKHRWKTYQIDSRNVEGTNKEQIQKWIDDYGEDSDFVRVRVRGEFPRAGSSQFIASDVVANARKYRAEGYSGLPKVLSVDVARFGDDQTVIGWRQGRKAVILEKLRGKDTVFVAERVIYWQQKEAPNAVVIDGDGIGAGVVDQIKFRGFGERLFEFHGGLPAHDTAAYVNRRAECWGLMREWLNIEAEIPDEPELEADLTGPEYGFSAKQQIQLERKEDMKKRGLASPDCGDMLAMTFAVKVAAPAAQPEPEMRYPGQDKLGWMGM